MARSNNPSHGSPDSNSVPIETSTLNGRIRYAFGTIIMAKMPDGVKDTKVAKGMRMLWPHMSKDLAKIEPDQLHRAATFINLIMQLCVEGVPTALEGMTFEDYLQAVFDGKIRVLPGGPTLLPADAHEASASVG